MSDSEKPKFNFDFRILPLAVAAAGLAFVFIYVSPKSDGPPDLFVEIPIETSTVCANTEKVIFERKQFCPGNRVRTFKRAGTLKPDDSGRPIEVELSAEKVGTIISNAPSPLNGEPVLALVKWDAQEWTEWGVEEPKTISLPEFEATVHADHITFER